jgi:Domain of unknown function (DUF4190)
MSSADSGEASPSQPGGPGPSGQVPWAAPEQAGGFDSPVPDSWGQPVPDSWTREPGPSQPGGVASSAPATWPGQAAQQTQPADQFGPAAADPWTQEPQQPWPLGQPAVGQYPAGQYPPGQYPPGQYGYQYFSPVAARSNRVAIWALVCGIGQFVLGLLLVGNILLAIPAIICGSIALKQTRLRGERGRGMAIAGLVLGILGVLYFLLVILIIAIGVHYRSS